MRRPTVPRAPGRRGPAILAASATLCTTALITAYALNHGPSGEGYAATGAVGGPSPGSGRPTGEVRLVPLDSPKSPSTAATSARSSAAVTPTPARTPGSPPGSPTGRPRTNTPLPGTPPQEPSPPPAPSTPITTTPAPPLLITEAAVRTPTDHRHCENVTLAFHNSGGSAVTSGTVTLGTHIIDSIGIDWATIESTHDLPTPIAPGTEKRQTWTVCVDAWRVPLGMRIETRDVSVAWE